MSTACAVDPYGRVAGILRCARHRCRERARLHAVGTQRGGGRRRRLRDRRAPALAESQRHRTGRAPARSAIGRTGARVDAIAHVHGRRRRERCGWTLASRPVCVPGRIPASQSREPWNLADAARAMATPSRRVRLCSNTSRVSIRAWARSTPCGRSPECRHTSCGSPSG